MKAKTELVKFTVKLAPDDVVGLDKLARDLEVRAGARVRGARAIVLRELLRAAIRNRSD